MIEALDRFDRNVLRARCHPLVGPASMHASTIRGGTGLSIYAASCKLELERRTLPDETPAQVLAELQELAGPEASVRLILDRPPLICSDRAKVACCVREAVTRVVGSEPVEVGAAFWMDSALFATAGIETVSYGADGAGAHEPEEWGDLPSVVACAEVLVEAARNYFAWLLPRDF